MSTLQILAINEELIGELYKAYAQRFLAYEDFWEGLADEESQHARWIWNLCEMIEDGSLYVDEKRFPKEAIETYHNYLKEELRRTRTEDMLLLNALSIVMYIEKSLIERRYFEVFTGDGAELREVLSRIKVAEEDHYDRVQKAWSENKR